MIVFGGGQGPRLAGGGRGCLTMLLLSIVVSVVLSVVLTVVVNLLL